MPGAGSLKAANYLYSIAPKDGSVIGIFAHGQRAAARRGPVRRSKTMARPFAAPPGIPVGRKAMLRNAFAETMRDPAFLADAWKLQLDIAPVSGDEIDAVIASLYATPKDVIARAQSILN